MNNHYHLILENTSGRLSSFIKQLNSQYGIYYRTKKGERVTSLGKLYIRARGKMEIT